MLAHPHPTRSAPVDDEPELKRRKVRKGTQSCWECKHRKVRCSFAAGSDSVCNGCKRRKTPCISQELPDDSAELRSSNLSDYRLNQLESTVERLVKRIEASDGLGIQQQLNSNDGRNPQNEILSSPCGTRGQDTGNAALVLYNRTGIPDACLYDRETRGIALDELTKPKRPKRLSPKAPTPPQRWSAGETERYNKLTSILIDAWPNSHDVELILSVQGDVSVFFHGTLCAPLKTLLGQQIQPIREILAVPHKETHPVLVARKLLLLATYLQGLPPSSVRSLDALSTGYHELMYSMVDVVHSYVTCNDQLLDSIESIECLMIESMYQNNAASMRSAWSIIRRAMLVAQMMGLDREVRPSSLKFLEMETRTRIYPENMWLRIVQTDRYLSLLLGMQQGSIGSRFAHREMLEDCTPLERMQRINCVAAGHILQRNEAGVYDLANTYKIDKLLRKASVVMPSKWWLTPSLTAGCDIKGNLEGLIGVMDQLAYYHLLTQLHLPYLLRSSMDHEYDYSKITAINASREMLMRFVSFRGSNSITSFCRGISFLAFISCTVICIAHIAANRQIQEQCYRGTVLDSLAHQRHSDRGIVELTIESMETSAREGCDAVTSRMAEALLHLLSIESDAASHGNYIAKSPVGDGKERLECGGKFSNSGRTLQIFIPHLGTIDIERDATSEAMLSASQPLNESSSAISAPESLTLESLISIDHLTPPEMYDKQVRQLEASSNQKLSGQFDALFTSNNPQTVALPCTQVTYQSVTDANGNAILDDNLFRHSEFINSAQGIHSNGWLGESEGTFCLEDILQSAQSEF